MKRHLLFGGEFYYPLGGWRDFIGSFDTVEEAMAAIKPSADESFDKWWHLLDATTGKIVAADGQSQKYYDEWLASCDFTVE